MNITWELSAVPYLPAMNLVARHMHNLTQTGIEGQMLSWSLGGYPSPNLQLAAEFGRRPLPTIEQALRNVAERRYGKPTAQDVIRAWKKFSEAFEQFPYHIYTLYRGPQQRGPANLLFSKPTGYRSTMVGYPYDDLNGWRKIYPPEVFAEQFEKVAKGFKDGLDVMQSALDKAQTAGHRQSLQNDLRIYEAACIHFGSVANQTRFITARDALLSKESTVEEKAKRWTDAKTSILAEIDAAVRLFKLTRQDARIGFEATNHYYYYPLDLVEKTINCRWLLDGGMMAQAGTGTSEQHK
ncbi:MAG: hypothetical protein ACYTF1_11865 [Planctomycetota bacterium]